LFPNIDTYKCGPIGHGKGEQLCTSLQTAGWYAEQRKLHNDWT